MRIRDIYLTGFKRFTDLTIEGIPDTAKLVILVGPSGSGKSSLFDAILQETGPLPINNFPTCLDKT